jgi:alkylation response protein AidB-like acyl-CoA dehydrogenase
MNFELSDEQRAIRDLARRFALEEVAPRARHMTKRRSSTGNYMAGSVNSDFSR